MSSVLARGVLVPALLLSLLAGCRAPAGGRYRMALVEHLRTAYWQENLWPRLDRVDRRP